MGSADQLSKEHHTLIPVFLESFASRQEYEDKNIAQYCDPNLRTHRQWNKKKDYCRKTAGCLQGVTAYFDSLTSFTCDECRDTRDNVCEMCSSWEVAMSGQQAAKATMAAAMLGKYIDHLDQGRPLEVYSGRTKRDGTPDERTREGKAFMASQRLPGSPSDSPCQF